MLSLQNAATCLTSAKQVSHDHANYNLSVNFSADKTEILYVLLNRDQYSFNMSDVKKTMKSVTRESEASKSSGSHPQPPTMNQNLQNITDNLIKIYDKLDSLESNQKDLDKKFDEIVEFQKETDEWMMFRVSALSAVVQTQSETLGRLIEQNRSIAVAVGRIDDQTASSVQSIEKDIYSIKDTVDSVHGQVSLIYEAIEESEVSDVESGEKPTSGVLCFVETLARSKDEYVTALQCEMEICRTQLLKSLKELLDREGHRSSRRSSSEKKERVRYIGKDHEF